ncbi:MAG TPA: molybdopterin-binding protein [Caldilineaceae bacterium]|nr:molybdopterin-binding protein [Caldilineaceae bacterium]
MLIRTGILMTPQPDEEAKAAVVNRLRSATPGAQVLLEKSSPGPRRLLEEILRRWCDEDELDLVITVGGTLPAPGPSGRETMPEATSAVVERLLPGLSEEMRAYAREVSALALLDRGVAGIRGRTLILNLPESAAMATLFLEAVVDPILAHLQEQADGPRFGDLAVAPTDDEKPQPPVHNNKLDAGEFAAFLASAKREG